MARAGSVALLVLATSGALAAPELPRSLCRADEASYFACRTPRARWIALCGNAPQALQYRYGRSAAAIELQFPADAASGAGRMLYAHYSRYQVERVELRFDNAGTGYTVFDYREGRRRSAGVRVVTAPGREQLVACAGRITSRLGELEAVLPCDADNALNVGGCR